MKTKQQQGRGGGVTFQFQGLAGLLVDTSRIEARRVRAFVRIFDKDELLAVSASSAPLQISPTEHDSISGSSSLVRHVAVWPDNSISVHHRHHPATNILRLQIVVKFPSGSTLAVGQCDWKPSFNSSVDLQVRAFRIEEAAVRIDTQGDSALRAHVHRAQDHEAIADSLGSLDYSFSQSETMLDTTDMVGSSLSIESTPLDHNKEKTNNSARKTKNRVRANDRFLASNMSPSMAMDPLAIRRLFRTRETRVQDEDNEPYLNHSVQEENCVNDHHHHLEFHPPKSAAVTVSKDHLEHLALNKIKVFAPSSSQDDDDDEESPTQSRSAASPTPIVPPVESIEFEKKEAGVPVMITPSPEKPHVKQATQPMKKSSKRLFGSKNKNMKDNKRKKKNSLLALEDREEPKTRTESSIPKRFSKIKTFFKRQWSPEKIYCEEVEPPFQKPLSLKERDHRVDTPTAEMSYALLSAGNCENSPENDDEDRSTELTRSIGEGRHDTLLQVRDQNVTPVDDFYSEALMEQYFSGKPCMDSSALVHITPETVSTVATTPERTVKALLHQPFLVEEVTGVPTMDRSDRNYSVVRSLPCNNSAPTQIGSDENLSAISEKSSPTSSSSNNNWSTRKSDYTSTLTRSEYASKPENVRTLDASTSFDAEIHGSPLPNEVAEEIKDSVDKPVHPEQNDWEEFDGNKFAADPAWVASTFNSADSAFSGISPRWRQNFDQDGPHQLWESLLIPKVEDTLSGHVHGERVQIKLKESPRDTSHSFDSPLATEDRVFCFVQEPMRNENLQTSCDELCSDRDDEMTRGENSDYDEQWIVFDLEAKEKDTNLCDQSNEEEIILFDDKDTHVHGIGSLVDWNVGEVYEPTEAFEDACQDLDNVSEKGSDVIVTTTQMNLDYSILSEEIMMDLLPSKDATPERTVDASPGRMAYLLSKSPKTPFPLSTLPSLSIENDKGTIQTKKFLNRKTKKKTFVRRFKEGIFGMLVCGAHVKVLSTDDDDDENDDDCLSYADSYPIWSQSSKHVDAKPKGKKKVGVARPLKRRSVQQKEINRKKGSASSSSYLGKHRDYRMHATFSDGGSPPCHNRVLSPALSDAEDLAWAKANASCHWI